MLDFLLIVVMAAHLLAMNVATAAPLVCVWLKRRQVRHADVTAGRLGDFLAWQSMIALAVGLVLGIAAVGLLWLAKDSRFFQALSIVPRRRLWFGLVELLFFYGVMLAYAWSWPRVRRSTWWHPALALLAATDLVYHFPPLFAAIAVLEEQSSLPGVELGYAEFLKWMTATETLARVVHFLLASFAVTGGLVLMWSLSRKRMADETEPARVVAWGARLALAPSVIQLLAGIWLLFALPRGGQQRLMGGDWLATGLLATSGVALFAMLHSLGALALGETSQREIVRSLCLMVLVVVAMTAVRHLAM